MPEGRVAAIDCGTNSIRLLICDIVDGRKTDLLREMRIVRLGAGRRPHAPPQPTRRSPDVDRHPRVRRDDRGVRRHRRPVLRDVGGPRRRQRRRVRGRDRGRPGRAARRPGRARGGAGLVPGRHPGPRCRPHAGGRHRRRLDRARGRQRRRDRVVGLARHRVGPADRAVPGRRSGTRQRGRRLHGAPRRGAGSGVRQARADRLVRRRRRHRHDGRGPLRWRCRRTTRRPSTWPGSGSPTSARPACRWCRCRSRTGGRCRSCIPAARTSSAAGR